jgi:LysR family transcriptional regulator, regulator for metE and metH
VRDLQVVIALAAAGSTARAASQLHLTQPAVSRALLALEDKLGVTLFERAQRGLSPTAAGERLLSGARAWLLGLQDLELRTLQAQAPARLRVVCECYTAYHWLPNVVAALHTTAPGLEVSIEMAHTQDPVAALHADAIDVALLTTGRMRGAGFVEQALFSDEVVFVVAPKHALASKPALTRADLRKHTLLTSTATPDAEAQWFLRATFGRKPPALKFQRLPLTEAIMEMARAGLGVAVLSEWIASQHLAQGDLVARRLGTGPLRRPWRIAYRRELAEPAQRLLAVLRSAVPHVRLVG